MVDYSGIFFLAYLVLLRKLHSIVKDSNSSVDVAKMGIHCH